MNIAFITTYNAKDISNWSGLGYYIGKSLEDCNNNVQYVGSLQQHVTFFDLATKIVQTKLLHQDFPIDRTVATAKAYARTVAKRLSGSTPDCVFCPGSIPIAYLETSVPKIIYTDATFACMLNYYDEYSNLSPAIIRQGHEIEKQALDTCTLAIFSSEWAAQSAIQYYGTDPAKVKIVPFGANFDMTNTEEDVNGFIYNKDKKTLKILFNGVVWTRKGGDIVLSAVEQMIKRGLQVELHLVGLKDLPFSKLPDFVINHGYLKKAVPEQRAVLEDLYKACHFLFLPSRAEASACVFSEAGLFGMPSISRKTGGVTSAIIDGKNGFTLNDSAGVSEYSDLICNLFLDNEKYRKLSLSSYREYQSRLNWKTAGESMTKLMKRKVVAESMLKPIEQL